MDEDQRRWEHWEDLPEDMEKHVMSRIARFFVGNNLGLLAQILLESGESFTKIFATLGMGIFGPYLEFFGADTYVAFFRKEGNARALMDQIEALEYKRKKWEEEQTKKEKEQNKKSVD